MNLISCPWSAIRKAVKLLGGFVLQHSLTLVRYGRSPSLHLQSRLWGQKGWTGKVSKCEAHTGRKMKRESDGALRPITWVWRACSLAGRGRIGYSLSGCHVDVCGGPGGGGGGHTALVREISKWRQQWKCHTWLLWLTFFSFSVWWICVIDDKHGNFLAFEIRRYIFIVE